MKKRRETVKKKQKSLNRLRQLLDEISGKSHEDITRHRQCIEALQAQCAHTIKWGEDGGGNKLDCWTYALGIPSCIPNATDPNILEEFFNSEVLKLLKEVPNSLDGGLVVYFCGDVPEHIGVMRGGRVVSKWGKNPVYNHGLFEVPAEYGDEVRYYQKPPEQFITTRFIEFVRSHERYVDCKEAFEEWVKGCGYGADRKPAF